MSGWRCSVYSSRCAPGPAPAGSGNGAGDGGPAVTVGQGGTVETIARRYGVPASAIMQANNISASGSIRPGQQLVIPRYSAASVVAVPPPAAAAAPASRPIAAGPKLASVPANPAGPKLASVPANPAGPKLASVPANPGVHVVAPGE